MSLRVNRKDIRVRRLKGGQDLYQATTAQVPGDVPLCPHQDAMAIERPIDRNLSVIGDEISAHFDRFGSTTFTSATAESPDAMGFVSLPDADAIVGGQLLWRLGLSVPRDVAGRRAQKAPVRGEATGDDARVGWLAKAHTSKTSSVISGGLTESCSCTSTNGYLRANLEMMGATSQRPKPKVALTRSRPLGVTFALPSNCFSSSISPRMRRACSR